MVGLGLEGAIAIAQQGGKRGAGFVGNSQVELTVAVEIPGSDRARVSPRAEVRLGPERTVTVAEQDGDSGGAEVPRRQIELAVAVEIGNRDGLGIGVGREV